VVVWSTDKGDKKAKRPPTSEALGLLTQLVGVSPFMMWRDTTPLPKVQVLSSISPPSARRGFARPTDMTVLARITCDVQDAPTRNHNEERLVLVGATSACLVQIEYNTNFQIGWAGLTWRMR
jgi:hypothetical protein